MQKQKKETKICLPKFARHLRRLQSNLPTKNK